MSDKQTVYLFYDKRTGSNSKFSNELTKPYTIENIMSSSDMEYYYDNEASELLKVLFSDQPYDFKNLDNKLYKTHIYKTTINTQVSYFTIIEINIEVLKLILLNYSTNNKIDMNNTGIHLTLLNIPNKNFLLTLCQYHIQYTNIQNMTKNGLNHYENSINDTIETTINLIMNNTNHLIDPIIEDPDFITAKLYNYQKKSIKWMCDLENNPKKVAFNLNTEIIFDNISFDLNKQTFMFVNNKNQIEFFGGCLIDEVGLGKTIQMTTLSLLNQSKITSVIDQTVAPNKFCSRATLILCPNQLCGQWKRELEKMINPDYDPNIITILTKIHYDKYTYEDLCNADFVIVSYSFLDNYNFLKTWLPKISSQKTYHKIKFGFKSADVMSIFEKMGNTLIKNPANIKLKNPNIFLIYWNRIIVDEFHEIYTVEKHCHMINFLPLFKGKYCWPVTGTPFEKNNDCLIKMINFISHYVEYDNKIFLNKDIQHYLIHDCFRRNTKQSINDEFKLPPLEEEVIWLKFSATERMIYNAYLANSNNNKFDIFLRQLCCHPQLAQETKDALANCKTLEDVEKMMVAHYKTDMEYAFKKYRNMLKRIKIIKKKITKLEKKIKKAQMKKAGIEVPDESSDESNDEIMSDIELENEELNNDNTNDGNINNGTKEVTKISVKNNEDNVLLMILPNNNGSLTLENLRENLYGAEIKLVQLKKEYDGKKTSYDFFNNVIERIRKTIKKSEEKDNEEKDNEEKDNEEKDNDSDNEEEEETCGICLDEIPESDIGVTDCGHLFCHECIKTVVIQKHECPYCRKKLNNNEVKLISFEIKKTKNVNNEQKNKNDLINEFGTKLANLICYLKSTTERTIVFSQWDSLLLKIGKIMSQNGIRNVFCRGNVYQRDKAIREFNQNDNIRVIMLSSESSASGANLTEASTVIFIDIVYGDYEYRDNTERQAWGRAYRIGQKNRVKIVRFIIKDTVEEEIYNMNKLEDAKRSSDRKIFDMTEDSVILKPQEFSDEEDKEDEEVTPKPKKIVKVKKSTKKTDQLLDDEL